MKVTNNLLERWMPLGDILTPIFDTPYAWVFDINNGFLELSYDARIKGLGRVTIWFDAEAAEAE